VHYTVKPAGDRPAGGAGAGTGNGVADRAALGSLLPGDQHGAGSPAQPAITV